MAVFQMDMSGYPRVTITEDGRLCSMGQHRPGFPQVLYDALLHLGYNGDVLVYRARMYMSHSMDQCEVSVTIPLDPPEPWMTIVNGVKLDDTVEQTTQVALASLCGSHLADTATMPIAHFTTRYQGDPVWSSLPHRHGCDGRVCSILIQPAAHHRQDYQPVAPEFGHL
jgi:hypothetical protein